MKLCEPLKEWRTDAPESLPFCTHCGRVIKVGMSYAVTTPRDRTVAQKVVCTPCSGLGRKR